MRYLCAAYADLDFYHIGIADSDVLLRLVELQNEGRIPQPSLLVYSGRGIWVLWLLIDAPGRDEPVRITRGGPELAVHTHVQQALHNRLAGLGADRAAMSVARYVRLPGSLNTKSETLVRWIPQINQNGQVRRYTLPELQRALYAPGSGTSAHFSQPFRPAERKTFRQQTEPGAVPARGRAGWEALRARRLADFRKLWRMRGLFRKGTRNNAVFYYSLLLASTGKSVERASLEVIALNNTFRPPLKHAAVQSAVKSAYSRRYPRLYDQTIADWLDIAPEEASRLKCQSIAARFQREGEPSAPKAKRAETDSARLAARHTAIRAVISESHGYVPSTRQMADALSKRGITVGHVTIAKDYARLGLSADRKKPCGSAGQAISLAS